MTTSPQPGRHEHRMERTFEVFATPEQVWDAIATADGISAWMVPATLDPQIGGRVTFDLGGMVLRGVVTDYSPPRRFAYEEPGPISADAPIPDDMAEWFESINVSLATVQEGLTAVTPLATEFLIESASGGSCVVRVVSSSYGSGADWEHEFFAEMVAGWSELLEHLAKHFDKAA